jgi:alkylation response protein AidB-like acyl-CoA dehydrogenase
MGANFFTDNEDLKFQFEHVIQWDEIADLTEFGYKLPGGHANLQEAKEFYRAVIESVGEYAGEFIAPRALQIDEEGNWLEDGEVKCGKTLEAVYQGLKERELWGMSVPRELGGSNCPLALFFVTAEILARADVSIMTHFGFHSGIALALLMYAAREGSLRIENGEIKSVRWENVIRQIAAGEAWGAMVLTEPDAGSDLGRIRTRAEQRGGKWYVTGEKIFITSGHGQWHIVLAKTEVDSGGKKLDPLKELSLFLVPRIIERDGQSVRNFEITKVEEKVGHHGSATCSLLYENSEAELIGKVGQGFELMLTLMNNARVGVGFEAIGISEAAYRQAREYAHQRRTMGQTIDRHPIVAEMLMDMELDIAGLRALAFDAANQVEISSKLDMLLRMMPPSDPEQKKNLERKQRKYSKRARLLTPLLKYAAAEAAVRITRNNMQIIGGPGYMREVGAEKLLRDALVLPIYEGTSQIQALMSLKDNMMNAMKRPGDFAREAARIQFLAGTTTDETQRTFYKAEASIHRALLAVLARIASKKLKRTVNENGWAQIKQFADMSKWDPKVDFSQGLVHAERFARALAELECARALLDQAARFPERRKIAERYVRRMAGRVAAQTDAIMANDQSVLQWIAEIQD